MEKTSVYLTGQERRRLAELAETTGRSQAQIIREAIAQYQPQMRGPRDFALAGSGEGPGDAVADLSDEELLQGFGQ